MDSRRSLFLSASALTFLLIILCLPCSSAMTSITDLRTNPDCSQLITSYIIHDDVTSIPAYENMTYGYEFTLGGDYLTCYHNFFYGVAITWDDLIDSFASVNYYSWSESSGTCTVGTTETAYDTKTTVLQSSNDNLGDSGDACGYTITFKATCFDNVDDPVDIACYTDQSITYTIYTNQGIALKAFYAAVVVLGTLFM